MGYINYLLLYKKNLSDKDFHILVKVSQKEHLLLEKYTNLNLTFERLHGAGMITFLKTVKDPIKGVRISKKGKEVLSSLSLQEEKEGTTDFCDQICELFESHDKIIGNKRRVLKNLNWFIKNTGYSFDEIEKGIEEWLSYDYKMWLENILWNNKDNLFANLNSPDLSRSPLYEFMRKQNNRKW